MELWVIEAPGKASTLQALLIRLGREARVQATKGHILSMPDKLNPIGIDINLHEFMREPKDIDIVKRIRDLAKEASAVYIATDADQEGDVIAWDVADLISDIVKSPLRVKLRGMDDDSIKDAIAEATPVSMEEAIPGRTRAIVDRMIGAAFSANGVAVGRVGTALLGLVASKKPSVFRLKLSAPAKDGGRPWLAETDIMPPLTKADANKLADLTLPALDFASSQSFTARPGHMGDIMVRASSELDMSPGETAKAMQRTYEAGRLSYPRSGSQAMSNIAARKLRDIFQKAGQKYDERKVAEKTGNDVHDAPYPIGAVDVSLDPRKLGGDEGVRTLIARDLVKTGQVHIHQYPSLGKLQAFLIEKGFSPEVSKFIAELPWRREQGPRYPGQTSWSDSKVEKRRPDTVLMEAVLEAGLGRPSTWANHIEGFMKRGLVDDDLNLTAKGRQWVAGSPPLLLDPRLSVAIERACERSAAAPRIAGREPWETLAERIIGALPPEIKQPVVALSNAEPARPRRDFKALAEPGIDFDALKSPVNALAYRPEEFSA